MARMKPGEHPRDNPAPVKALATEQAGCPILVADCPCCSTVAPVKIAIPHVKDEEGHDLAHCPTCGNYLKLSPA